MKIPLDQIDIVCSECKESNTLQEVNDDCCRYHDEHGQAFRFPKDGVAAEQIEKIKTTDWLCECCQEEKEERS